MVSVFCAYVRSGGIVIGAPPPLPLGMFGFGAPVGAPAVLPTKLGASPPPIGFGVGSPPPVGPGDDLQTRESGTSFGAWQLWSVTAVCDCSCYKGSDD